MRICGYKFGSIGQVSFGSASTLSHDGIRSICSVLLTLVLFTANASGSSPSLSSPVLAPPRPSYPLPSKLFPLPPVRFGFCFVLSGSSLSSKVSKSTIAVPSRRFFRSFTSGDANAYTSLVAIMDATVDSLLLLSRFKLLLLLLSPRHSCRNQGDSGGSSTSCVCASSVLSGTAMCLGVFLLDRLVGFFSTFSRFGLVTCSVGAATTIVRQY